MRHLREKIERDPREPELILTVRGAGYRFRDWRCASRWDPATLAVALLAIVGGALGGAYLMVVPSLGGGSSTRGSISSRRTG